MSRREARAGGVCGRVGAGGRVGADPCVVTDVSRKIRFMLNESIAPARGRECAGSVAPRSRTKARRLLHQRPLYLYSYLIYNVYSIIDFVLIQ